MPCILPVIGKIRCIFRGQLFLMCIEPDEVMRGTLHCIIFGKRTRSLRSKYMDQMIFSEFPLADCDLIRDPVTGVMDGFNKLVAGEKF